MTSIGNGAFIKCTSITSITIPINVKNIGEYAFAYWDIPEIISEIDNPFYINENTFSNNTYYYATLYVPKGSIEKYRSTKGWNLFARILESSTSSINETENSEQIILNRYTLNGNKVLNPKKGINIIKMNNGEIIKIVVR